MYALSIPSIPKLLIAKDHLNSRDLILVGQGSPHKIAAPWRLCQESLSSQTRWASCRGRNSVAQKRKGVILNHALLGRPEKPTQWVKTWMLVQLLADFIMTYLNTWK